MNKQRLTITLSQSTLNKIDHLIDKKQVRSRSHAIETILQQQLKPTVQIAVILAGGQANSSEIKPLLQYRDRPLIFHIIDHLKSYEISEIIILASKQAQELKTKISAKYPKLKVRFVFEEQPLGTAGALKNAKQWLTHSFFCLHGDVFTDLNLQELAEFHHQHQSLATIAVKPRMSRDSFDNISMQGSQVTAFQPRTKNHQPSLVNSGVYLFEPEIMHYIPDKNKAMLETDVFPQLAEINKLQAFTFDGICLDITTES